MPLLGSTALPPVVTAPTDYAVWESVRALIEATDLFDAVLMPDNPNLRGEPSDERYVAVVTPKTLNGVAEAGAANRNVRVRTGTATLTVYVREQNPGERYKAASEVIEGVAVAFDGSNLAGGTNPTQTVLNDVAYGPDVHPELTATATLTWVTRRYVTPKNQAGA